MNDFYKLIGKLAYHLGFGYTVYCAEFNGWHWSPDWADALEWMACYPAGASVTICKGTHQMVVASR